MLKKEKTVLTITFLFPALCMYSVFVLYPIFRAFYICFFKWSGLSANMTFVGFNNFIKLFTNDPIFWMSFKQTLLYLVIICVATLFLALLFATVVSQGLKWSKFFQIIFFWPSLLSIVAVSVLWIFIYSPRLGVLNSLLRLIGLDGWTRIWLAEKGTALPSVAFTIIWMWVGFHMVLFISGLQKIPEELYEAARIDGANSLQSFRYITVPLMWETLRVAFVYILIQAFKLFAPVYVMTQGAPDRTTENLATYIYKTAFHYNEWGYATAMGVIMFLFILCITMMTRRLTKRQTVQY